MKLSTKIILPIILISALLILLNGCFLTPSEEQPALTLYTVTYDGNENTGGEVPVDANLYKEGDLVTVLGNTGPKPLVNTGYDFYGWNTAKDGSGTARPVGYVFAMGTSDVTLYAMWDVSPAFTPTTPTPALGGGGGGYVPPAAPCVDSLEVDPESMVLCYDSSGSFTLDAIYDDASFESLLGDPGVDYSYTTEGIVTVDGATGEITADKCGTTTINISYTDPVCGGDPKTASIDVEVKGALTGLQVTTDPDPMELCLGDTGSFTLKAVYDCGRLMEGLVSLLGDVTVVYDYDPSIVSVDKDGTITAVGCGETTIVISYADSVCEVEKTASIEVEVKEVVIVIDGILSIGEWCGATEIPVKDSMGTVWVLATVDYLYVAFDVVDSTDARKGENSVGNDKIGLNINPTPGVQWGKPCDIIFQTGADPDAFTSTVPPKISSGMSDSWYTEWVIEGTQYDLPGDLETKTLYNGNRISEWKVPLASIAPSVGDFLAIAGATDIDVGVGSYTYPVDLDWANLSTYVDIIVY